MAILVKNTSTNEVTKVNNVRVFNNEIVAEWQCCDPKQKFFEHYPFMVRTERTQFHEERGKECRVFTLADGFELVTKTPRTRKENTKKQEVKRETKQEETKQETRKEENVKREEIKQETKETKEKETSKDNTPKVQDEDAKQLMVILSRMKGGNIDADKVREIVREELANAKETENKTNNTQTVEIKILGKETTAKVSNPHPLLEKVLKLVANDRAAGRYPWLFGPAGSGKSTLAKQVAEAMNLPFYSVSSLQQKYELEGYTDAVGNLVETTFYKAAKEGGIFLFDEASTTSGEVQVAWNSMLANLWYNFPKEGMVTAHPDFHVIAADNTTGRGGNSTYSARFQVDASTLDRYTCVKVEYTDAHDLFMAENDTELVDFMKDLRKAIELARLTYTASPRAIKAIKTYQKLFDDDLEAFDLGLCSGWSSQDIKTLAARLSGENKYYKLFNRIANI